MLNAAIGNLKTRSDLQAGITQHFCYDNLNRLVASRFGSCTSATKSGQPTKTVAYSPFNTPTQITWGSKTSTLVYGPNQDRIKHSDSNGRVTTYIGGVYEEVTKGGVTYYIHRLGDIGQMVSTGTHTTASVNYEYTHRDQLGSIVAVTGKTLSSAADIKRQSNGAWGERRYQQWNGPQDNALIPQTSARGFTDHEHMDAVGLIHMNGRVYDPELGRFLSADPIIQSPYNTQSYNRYSYVFNNPLSFTDPSGFTSSGGSGYQDYGSSGSSDVDENLIVGSWERLNNSFTQSNNINLFMNMERMTQAFEQMQRDKEISKLQTVAKQQAILGMDNSETLNEIEEKKWSNMDAYVHYMSKGGDVTLRKMGHLGTIQNSLVTKGVMSRFDMQISSMASKVASEMKIGKYEFSLSFENSYSFREDKFFFGSGVLSGFFYGQVAVYGNTYFYQGSATIKYSDEYKDPYDLGNWFKKDVETGDPYFINDQWARNFNGYGSH